MGLNIGNLPVRQVYVGSTPVASVYVGAKKVWPTSEVHEVSLTDVYGSGTVHPLLTVTVPAGGTWSVRIQGTVTKSSSAEFRQPEVRIGDATFGPYGTGEAVDCSGTVTSADTTIAIVTNADKSSFAASFVGTVTIEK